MTEPDPLAVAERVVAAYESVPGRRPEAPFATPDGANVAELAGALRDALDLVEVEMPVARPEVNRARFVLAFPPDAGA